MYIAIASHDDSICIPSHCINHHLSSHNDVYPISLTSPQCTSNITSSLISDLPFGRMDRPDQFLLPMHWSIFSIIVDMCGYGHGRGLGRQAATLEAYSVLACSYINLCRFVSSFFHIYLKIFPPIGVGVRWRSLLS